LFRLLVSQAPVPVRPAGHDVFFFVSPLRESCQASCGLQGNLGRKGLREALACITLRSLRSCGEQNQGLHHWGLLEEERSSRESLLSLSLREVPEMAWGDSGGPKEVQGVCFPLREGFGMKW
jgi:hypothetical protein